MDISQLFVVLNVIVCLLCTEMYSQSCLCGVLFNSWLPHCRSRAERPLRYAVYDVDCLPVVN